MRVVDTLIVFRILKMLTTPFTKQAAYKFGFIDDKGNRIKLKSVEGSNQKVENKPKTAEEKASLTPLHRLVFNLKKIIEKVPFGKTQFASYAVALALLKENQELDDDQLERLEEEYYKWLKEEGIINSEMIAEELANIDDLERGKYRLRRHTIQVNYPFENVFEAKSELFVNNLHSQFYGIKVYAAVCEGKRILVTADDVY